MTPKQALDALRFVVHSHNHTSYLASVTNIAVQEVNRTVVLIYDCVTSNFLANNTLSFWNCLTTPTTAPVNIDVYCQNLEYDLYALAFSVLFILSVLFLLVMSFVEKRKYRLKCCNGRPGVIVPVNLLDSYENRFGNALAFGVTTSSCLNVLIGDVKYVLGTSWGSIIDSSPGFVSIFFKMIATILIAIAAYPLFVCMRIPHKRGGSIFGIFYCILWLSLQGYRFGVFSNRCLASSRLGSAAKRIMALQVCGELPQTICLFILLLKFMLVLVKAVQRRAEVQGDLEDIYDDFQEGYMFKHVQSLVKHVPLSSTAKVDENAKPGLKDKIYKWKPEFQYSTRVIAAFMVSGIILYLLTLYLLYICWYYIDFVLGAFAKTETFESYVKSIFPNDRNIVETVRTYLRIWTVCFYVAIIFSTIKTVLVFLNMLAWYRGHIMRLRRGDRSWLPSSIRTLNASPSSLVAASMKYAGFQVAYASWGYIMFAILIWIILSIVVSMLFYPLFHGQSSPLLRLLYNFWPGLLISLVVAYSQRLAAMFIFLQQRGKIISIDNRNAFHVTSYFLFFFNIFLGLISCLLRIFKGMVVGVLFLERVQKSILPRSFEKIDPGYFAYIGYILTEHAHANPVLCVFFYLFRQHAKSKNKVARRSFHNMQYKELDELSLKNCDIEAEEKCRTGAQYESRWKIIRNRWNLAYTLVNNPSLAEYRKHNLNNDKEESECSQDNEPQRDVIVDKKDLSICKGAIAV